MPLVGALLGPLVFLDNDTQRPEIDGACDVVTSLGRLLEICVAYVDLSSARYRMWGRLYCCFGLPAAILAVLVGAAAVSTLLKSMSLDWLVAVLALGYEILGAVVGFLKSEQHRGKQRELMVGWMELGDRVQFALMEAEVQAARSPGGQLSREAEASFLRWVVELNKAKFNLLSGKLRAGPERGQGEAPAGRGTEQKATSDPPEGTQGPGAYPRAS